MFQIKTVRNPFPKFIRAFLPAIILGMFLWCTFDVKKYADRIANMSICMLSYIAIMETLRSNLPEMTSLTFADKFLMMYIGSSLLPLIKDFNHWYDGDEYKTHMHHITQMIHLIVMLISIIWLIYMWCPIYNLIN